MHVKQKNSAKFKDMILSYLSPEKAKKKNKLDETPEEISRKQSMADIKKLLKQPNDTQLRIERAKYHWGVIRRKKLVITMLKRMKENGLEFFLERLKNNDHQK